MRPRPQAPLRASTSIDSVPRGITIIKIQGSLQPAGPNGCSPKAFLRLARLQECAAQRPSICAAFPSGPPSCCHSCVEPLSTETTAPGRGRTPGPPCPALMAPAPPRSSPPTQRLLLLLPLRPGRPVPARSPSAGLERAVRQVPLVAVLELQRAKYKATGEREKSGIEHM